MAKKKKEEVLEVEVPKLQIGLLDVTLVGDTPLLVNKFSEKAKKEIEQKQQGKGKTKKASRDPAAEFEAARYKMSKNRDGIPAAGVKNCAVSACRFIDGMKMTHCKGSFHVLAEENGLVPIKATKPVLDERMVKIGGAAKISTPAYRPRFDNWQTTFTVRYNTAMISPAQIFSLYDNAGFGVGLCEFRPERSGSLGMFHVAKSHK